MAFLTEIIQSPTVPNFLTKKLSNLKKSYINYRLYSETKRELSALSTQELADINIIRCDIPRIARAAVSQH